ncbi:guanine nucleotide-binding protein subunit gamma 1-like [Cornus florida]|uniref:guanine nucleotide-binding protein subunit gamma 1-like n=1 Tax=Cornus florida TaxID=4283 RepID=UPI00289BFA06|nr:guanine nucleotide-binding protein subunit gamma 1-like [Cornus florida]
MDSISREIEEQETNLPSSSSSPSPPSGGVGNINGEGSVSKGAGTPTFMGKHRMAAAIASLHQQIQIIQEELDLLETVGESSIVCKELISSVESAPDALLPLTKGPAIVGWDRWFQGAHGTRGRKRWI